MNRWNLEERERTLKCVWYACACVALEKSIIITQTTMGKFELFYPLAFPHLTAKGPRALFVRIFFPKRSKRERDLRFLRLWFPLFSHPFLYWYCPSFFAFNYKDHLHSLSFSCVCACVWIFDPDQGVSWHYQVQGTFYKMLIPQSGLFKSLFCWTPSDRFINRKYIRLA